ncbi:hypothetical protein [Rhodococcus sp. (in: high G+C Gram-positive bacteria)]|uniref:hypothetical protein n=1 Tax=Rhodococcus sp. TaxID=1831 RepID=UPI00388ECFB1
MRHASDDWLAAESIDLTEPTAVLGNFAATGLWSPAYPTDLLSSLLFVNFY